jgi:TonB family protein
MVEVLQVLTERGEKESSLAFLERIENGALDEAAAHQLWTCLGGDALFLTPTAPKQTPAPCETVPTRKGSRSVEYPDSERRRRRQGKALVFARINVDGTVAPIWVAAASTPEFGAAAAQSVGRFAYFPATCSGVPIPYPMIQYIDFRLK